MSVVEVSLIKLIEALRNNEIGKLREELSKAERIVMDIYRLPRFEVKIRGPDKRLVTLNRGVLDRLEYALFKAILEAAKSNKLPTFKDVAEISSDYKASAKYITLLAETGYIVFPDPAKAAKLLEAVKAISESKYQRCISKVLDLPLLLNVKALEENADKILCSFKDDKLTCNLYSHGEARDQEKVQVKVFNEYI